MKNTSSTNTLILIVLLVILIVSMTILARFKPEIIASLMILPVLIYIAAFILDPIYLLSYLVISFSYIMLFNIFSLDDIRLYIPYLTEIIVGSLLIYFLNRRLNNYNMIVIIFAVFFGRLFYYLSSYLVLDFWLNIMSISDFFLNTISKEVFGVILNIILVPLVIYGIKKNTVVRI
ncbi:MAG: hypothetical protein MR314_04600 [Ezakiella sp.]|nr:hypothetical protein [Ezakiella sp.]